MTRPVIITGFWTCACVMGFAASSHSDDRGEDPAASPQTSVAVVGFENAADSDARDHWMPVAFEEILTWRLRRVPGLVAIPTVRLYQARQELARPDETSPSWTRAVTLGGAKRQLSGSCSGPPEHVVLKLRLEPTAGDSPPAETTIGPARLFEVLDQATRWTLARLGVDRVDTKVSEVIFAPPCATPTALEYYAKAIAASRDRNTRDAVFFVRQALDYDTALVPAQLFMAQLELMSSKSRAAASGRLRSVGMLASTRGDLVSQTQAELAQGLILVQSRSYDAAEKRFRSALDRARDARDGYGELAALNNLSDLHLLRCAGPGADLAEAERDAFVQKHLAQAIELQKRALARLVALGDGIAQLPALNKLALTYEQANDDAHAEQMHRRTLALAQQTGIARSEASAWLFLGQWLFRQKRYPDALQALTSCLKLAPEQAARGVHESLADIHAAMNHPRESLVELQKARALVDASDLSGQLRMLRRIADIQIQLGQTAGAIETLSDAADTAHALQLADDEKKIRERVRVLRAGSP